VLASFLRVPVWECAPSEAPGKLVLRCDVAVVGAGPAGAAAAVTAVGAGTRVVLLDAEARPGGQYWRHGPGGPAGLTPGEHAAEWRALARRLDHALASGRLTYLARSRVWRVDAGESGSPVLLQAVRADGGECLEASVPLTVEAAAVVLAPGAHDRVLPFPGWDVPGVLTAGAAQALLKEHSVRAGSRAVVAGTGPFLLRVAAGLAEAGVRVLEVDEAVDGRGWARGWRAAAGAPAKIADGVRYGALLARHRVPVHLRHAVVAAHGSERLDAVTIARTDDNWRVVPGSQRRVECDVVAVSWGFTARLELALQAGCATEPGPDGAPAVRVDAAGRTSVPGVLAAGELTGIAGAEQALLDGAVAGNAAAAVAAGREPATMHRAVDARRARLAAFAAAMHAAHPVHDGWTSWLVDATVVCRCEEVSAGDVRAAIGELGADDARTVKLLTRAGMGWCQGRMCGEAVARLVATTRGVPFDPYADLLAGSARSVASPVRLAAVAASGVAAGVPADGPDTLPDPSSGGSS
jgi:NADPH-dependent 2,4-dienoyl-CoA reductase/sulfur reductase-like enzyme